MGPINVIKLLPETLKMFEDIGIVLTLSDRKAYFLPYILVQYENRPPGDLEIINVANGKVDVPEDYRVILEFIGKSDVV